MADVCAWAYLEQVRQLEVVYTAGLQASYLAMALGRRLDQLPDLGGMLSDFNDRLAAPPEPVDWTRNAILLAIGLRTT